jgi:hypothetical protein
MFGNAPQHIGANFNIIVKCPSVNSRVIWMNQLNVGGPFAAPRFRSPSEAK